jgi:Asp-tRNA(Asn)/Glu-tRNA(Gln) amidotransferase A subunit family amidase
VVSVLAAAILATDSAAFAAAQPAAPFHVLEATIDGIHGALRSRRLTCVRLVQAYLNRIAAYDQRGPTLNAIQNVNQAALQRAAELDGRLAASGQLSGKLHCVPVLLKDNIATAFMPTTYGSALFKSFVPGKNATVVDRLLAEGAIILAKTNMGEFSQGYSGSAFGDCHNAYDPRRSPSGSSCGTGVGVAANFAAVGIGEDSNGSIRGPASHGSLIGLRPTLQLVSRAGLIPFDSTRDTLGPLTRTVRDAALVLDVIAGYDAEDPVTAWSVGRKPPSYTSFLVADGLRGMRFGVIREPLGRNTDTDAADYKEVQAAITAAALDMRRRGAEIVDPIAIPGLQELAGAAGGGAADTESAVNAFLAAQPNAPVRTLREIVNSPLVLAERRQEMSADLNGDDAAGQLRGIEGRERLRVAILKAMADSRVDALIFATYDHAPTQVPVSTPGSNRAFASALGFPAMTVPGGYFRDGMPIGLELVARPFDEGTLFKAAFDYEQTTKHRRPPALLPALAGEP